MVPTFDPHIYFHISVQFSFPKFFRISVSLSFLHIYIHAQMYTHPFLSLFLLSLWCRPFPFIIKEKQTWKQKKLLTNKKRIKKTTTITNTKNGMWTTNGQWTDSDPHKQNTNIKTPEDRVSQKATFGMNVIYEKNNIWEKLSTIKWINESWHTHVQTKKK